MLAAALLALAGPAAATDNGGAAAHGTTRPPSTVAATTRHPRPKHPRKPHHPRKPARPPKIAAPTGGLAPIPQPSAAKPLVILKIGDSLGEELGFGLHDVLGPSPYVQVLQEAVGDTGLARPDYYNWPVHLAQELSQYHPRAVVVMLGGDDGQNFNYGNQVVQFGSPTWQAVYSQRVAAMMHEATAAGAHVLWVGLPIMSSPYFASEMARMNAIYAAQAAVHPGVTFVPTWSLFANARGQYSAYLPGAGGQLVLMRNPDGVHFSGAGADRLASALVAPMERAWKIRLFP